MKVIIQSMIALALAFSGSSFAETSEPSREQESPVTDTSQTQASAPARVRDPWAETVRPFSYLEFGATGTSLDKPIGTHDTLYGLQLTASLQLGKYAFASFNYHRMTSEVFSGDYKVVEKNPAIGGLYPTSTRNTLYGRYTFVNRDNGNDGRHLELGTRYRLDPWLALSVAYQQEDLDFSDASGFKVMLSTVDDKKSGWSFGYSKLEDSQWMLSRRFHF